jgi:hypothetical protein
MREISESYVSSAKGLAKLDAAYVKGKRKVFLWRFLRKKSSWSVFRWDCPQKQEEQA